MEVRPADDADRPLVVDVLATAFADDPVVRWLLPRTRRDRALFGALVRCFHAAPGATDIAIDDGVIVGAALWDPPGHLPGRQRAVAGAVRMALALGPALGRGVAVEREFGRRRPTEPHWYLAQIGATNPGRGAGTALLGDRLGRLSGPAYLESTHPANVPLYERHGFAVVERFDLPHGGPPVWTMRRPG